MLQVELSCDTAPSLGCGTLLMTGIAWRRQRRQRQLQRSSYLSPVAGCLNAAVDHRPPGIQRADMLAASPAQAAMASVASPRRLPHCRAAAPTRLHASMDSRAACSKVAEAQNFSVFRVAGDGRCLFRSLAQGAHLAAQADATTQQVLQPLAPLEETDRADELRQAICDELLQRRCSFSVGRTPCGPAQSAHVHSLARDNRSRPAP
jgi:hypothetical protein